jgi:hypothetical protein
VDELVHHRLQLFHTLDPFIFNRIGQASEDIELVFQAAGNRPAGPVDLFVLRVLPNADP